jgi:GNAT superfamily N-acetyltransferase
VKIGSGKVLVLDLEREIHFPRSTAFIMDSFIHHQFRGRKLFHVLIGETINGVYQKGYKSLYCHIRSNNIRSISAYKKNGFEKIGTLFYKRLLWKRTLELSPSFSTLHDFRTWKPIEEVQPCCLQIDETS